MAKKQYLFLCLFILFGFTGYAQSPKLNGVYVGAELYNTPFNGMQINNIVLFFRGNGTFNNTLNKPDWRTGVSGSYTITNNMVQLYFKNGDEGKKYKLAANGNLESTSGIKHTLHKVKSVTAIPAGAYEKRSASTSGGMGTGMPAVGAFSSDYLRFDGKGNFSADRSSVVGVAGDAVGGKFGKNSKSGGTYKLSDAAITLTFGNGTVTKHSFFYSPPNEEDLILVDGEFYFREDGKEETATTKRTTAETKIVPATPSSGLPAAATILSKLRAQYGGESIDKLNTVKEIATITGGMQVVMLMDIANTRMRAEVRQGGKLLMIKQLDENGGWQWMNGAKKALSAEDKNELMVNLYQGIAGLHKKLNSYLSTAKVTESGDDYILTFYVNKNKVVYLVGNDYTIKGNAYTIAGGTPQISVYKDFTAKNGITYPATTESSDGKTKLVSNTTAITFNPVLTPADWATP